MTSRRQQRGYLLITVVVALFLLATVAVLLTHGSSIGANTASVELETARGDYVAQAAMQHALWRAENNACMGDVTIPAIALGSDSYDATITGAAAGTVPGRSLPHRAFRRPGRGGIAQGAGAAAEDPGRGGQRGAGRLVGVGSARGSQGLAGPRAGAGRERRRPAPAGGGGVLGWGPLRSIRGR